jgi:hypothetical protein
LTESNSQSDAGHLEELRARADALEQQLNHMQQEADRRLIRAELKAEAARAGMIDLDGLKLVDLSSAKLNDKGEVEGAAAMMGQLKRSKPWLFGNPSSSSAATPPVAQPPRQKRATEMTDAEYRAARAELLKRRY